MDRTVREDTGVKQQILRRIYLFSGIDEADLSTLARMAVKKTFPASHHLWGGERGPGVLSAHHRPDKTVKEFPGGQRYIIRLVGPGETFAEAAVFGEIPYPATAIALEDCHTLFFPKGPFLQHLAASPALARNMLATLSRLMFHLTKQLEDLSLKEVSARLARYILERCHQTHGEIAAGLHCELPTTKTQLAAHLGTISETLSRTLSRFKSLGLIEVDKGKITIVDPVALHKMAQGSKS